MAIWLRAEQCLSGTSAAKKLDEEEVEVVVFGGLIRTRMLVMVNLGLGAC